MKNSWISTKDRLPEKEDYMLVYLANGDFDIAWYSVFRKQWFWNTFDRITESTVEYWQPLVKPKGK